MNATINRLREYNAPGDLFIVAAPTLDPGSASNTARTTGYLALFYTAGDTCKTLTATPWGHCDENGLKVVVKEETLQSEAQDHLKQDVAVMGTTIDLEWTFKDMDVLHLADVMGCKTDELIAMAAASGKAGRKRLLIGGSRSMPKYTILWKTPSQDFSGEFDNFVFTRCVVHVDFTLDLSRTKVRTCTVKASLQPDPWLINADGFPEMAFLDEVTAASL